MPLSTDDAVPTDARLAGVGPRRAGSALNMAAVIVAALYFGRELLIPLVLAVLLAFVLAPLVAVLRRARLGRAPAVLVAVTLAVAAIFGIGAVVGGQATNLAASLPAYQSTIQDKAKALTLGTEMLGRINGTLQAMLGADAPADTRTTAPSPAPLPAPLPVQAPAAAPTITPSSEGGVAATFALARVVLEPLVHPLATIGVVIVFVIFILLYRNDLRDRFVRLAGRNDLHRTILAMNDAARRLSRYFLFQLALNAGFGVFITAGLWFIGLPNPVLWGITAALMRFVPFIGSFIAVVPPFLLALAVTPGWTLALLVLGLFLFGDLVMGQVIEPLLYGHSTGLSPIAVILAAAFWAFLWGPVGLLLATPLTVCLVVLGRHVESLSFLEVTLGDAAPLTPPETFYQRALEGNAGELAGPAAAAIARGSLAEYYDQVALRGLALAQADLSRDALAFERLEAIHGQVEGLLATAAAQPAQAGQPQGKPPVEWQVEGVVVCIPARGQLDGLAATMAMQVMRDAGFGAREESNLMLGAGRASAGLGATRLCCLSVLDQGSSPSGIQYLLRRIQRQMPDAAVVVGLWHADGASPLLASLRAEGRDETIVLSLGELVALARAISARKPGPEQPGPEQPSLDEAGPDRASVNGSATARNDVGDRT